MPRKKNQQQSLSSSSMGQKSLLDLNILQQAIYDTLSSVCDGEMYVSRGLTEQDVAVLVDISHKDHKCKFKSLTTSLVDKLSLTWKNESHVQWKKMKRSIVEEIAAHDSFIQESILQFHQERMVHCATDRKFIDSDSRLESVEESILVKGEPQSFEVFSDKILAPVPSVPLGNIPHDDGEYLNLSNGEKIVPTHESEVGSGNIQASSLSLENIARGRNESVKESIEERTLHTKEAQGDIEKGPESAASTLLKNNKRDVSTYGKVSKGKRKESSLPPKATPVESLALIRNDERAVEASEDSVAEDKNRILQMIPKKVQEDFRQVCFAEWSNSFFPAIQLSPFDVPHTIRETYLTMAEKVIFHSER
jgi:hypothetical protein